MDRGLNPLTWQRRHLVTWAALAALSAGLCVSMVFYLKARREEQTSARIVAFLTDGYVGNEDEILRWLEGQRRGEKLAARNLRVVGGNHDHR